MDAWVQGSLWSNVDLVLNVNLLDLEELSVKISFVPFHLIPMWSSLYYTHPAAVYQGIVDEFAAALDFGYEVHAGALSVGYYHNSLVPKVSLSDYALGTSTVLYPEATGSTFASNVNGVKGWDWNTPRTTVYTDEPYFNFDLLEYLNSEGKIEFESYASYLMIPLIGESIGAAQ
jgi:hypothetical protein